MKPKKLFVLKLNYLWLMLLMMTIMFHHSVAQDIQFSQYYNAPLYINPAFAGSAHNSRIILNQRLQWPGIDAKYTTSMVSLDTYSEKYRSGYGLTVIQDYQGSNNISSTEIGLQYSYDIHISQKYSFRPGIQLSYASRNLNYAGLYFSKDVDVNGRHTETFGRERKSYLDASSGGIFYSKDFFIGISGHHLNRPNQSFQNEVSRLPAKYTFVAGYKIPISNTKYMGSKEDIRDISLTPTAYYKTQGKSDQIDLGIYFKYDDLLLGLWYRGIPVKNYERGLQNNESFIVLLGWKLDNFIFGYSYDYTLSKLAIARTGGSHELSITFINHKKYKKRKPMRRLPCPTFLK